MLAPLQSAHSFLATWAPDLPSARTEFHGAIKMPVQQKILTNAMNEGTRTRVLNALDTSERAMFRSFVGQGAGTWLEGPPDVSCILPDPHLADGRVSPHGHAEGRSRRCDEKPRQLPEHHRGREGLQ